MTHDQIDTVKALEIFAEICNKHDIDYFLLAGTCLGGVRHQGMIPWDDDIDIGVPNEQYDRLEKNISKELPAPYEWRNASDNYPRYYWKIILNHSCCIDVFRLVRFPDDILKRKLIWFTRKILFRAINIKYYQKDHPVSKHFLTNPLSTFIGKLYAYQQLQKWMRKVERYSEKHAGEYRINLHSVYSMEKEMIPVRWLESPSHIIFEGNSYPTVSDPHSYLTNLYGDYMTPPPENERNVKQHPEKYL